MSSWSVEMVPFSFQKYNASYAVSKLLNGWIFARITKHYIFIRISLTKQNSYEFDDEGYNVRCEMVIKTKTIFIFSWITYGVPSIWSSLFFSCGNVLLINVSIERRIEHKRKRTNKVYAISVRCSYFENVFFLLYLTLKVVLLPLHA